MPGRGIQRDSRVAEPLAGKRRVGAVFQVALGHGAIRGDHRLHHHAHRLVQMHEGGRGPPPADLQNMRVEESARAGLVESYLRGPEPQPSVDDQLDAPRFRRHGKCARWHDRAACQGGPETVEEGRQRSIVAVALLGRRIKDQPVAGARLRHVEQALLLLGLARAERLQRAAFGARDHPVGRRTGRRRRRAGDGVAVEPRNMDAAELQALGAVDGHQTHGVEMLGGRRQSGAGRDRRRDGRACAHDRARA